MWYFKHVYHILWESRSLKDFVAVKVKQSYYGSGQALRLPGGWGSQISRQSAHEGGKVVSHTHRPPLPPGNICGTLSVRGWVNPRAIVRLERLCQWKIPVTPSGIEPATFWLVAQCLNQLRHHVPHFIAVMVTFVVEKCEHSHCLEKKLNLYKNKKLERECVTFLCLQKQGKLSKLERDKITVYLV